MTPEIFTGANTLLKGPEDWDVETMGRCSDLPAFVGNGLVMSVWRPTKEEIALLAGGGVVLLTLVTDAPPPAQVEVVHTTDACGDMAQA